MVYVNDINTISNDLIEASHKTFYNAISYDCSRIKSDDVFRSIGYAADINVSTKDSITLN